MNKLSKKSLLFFVTALACSAFASSASAANWDPPNTRHTLTANLGFNSALLGGGADCTAVTFEADVSALGSLTITSATFDNCVGTGGQAGCPVASTATGLPWEVTAINTTDIVIHNIVVDSIFNGACGGSAVRLTGSPTATWSNTTHGATFTNAALTVHAGASALPATLNGAVDSDPGTLIIT